MTEPAPTRLERLALRMTALAERYLPDALPFALLGTLLVAVLALALQGMAPDKALRSWGDGVWSLAAFSLQMAMIVIGGTVVATAPAVARAVDRLAALPTSERQATVLCAVVSMATSWFNWGFGLLFSAVLVRAVARRLPAIDYRTLAATSLLGLGTVWAQGLSGSAALQMATPGMLAPAIRAIAAGKGAQGAELVPGGIISLQHTIFLWQSLVSVLVEVVVVAALIAAITPIGPRARTASQLGVDLSDPHDETDDRPHVPGQWLEHQAWLGRVIGALGLAAVVLQLLQAEHVAAAITLNTVNLTLLSLGFWLHRTPARLARAFARATPATWGLLLQFPLYGGIAAVITDSKLSERVADWLTAAATPLTYPPLVAAYSAILGVFVPSGGSKWVIEAPYVLAAAHRHRVHLGWMVAVYDLGEAVANLVQPFWMLPVLGLLGLRARDVMGVTWTVALVVAPLVLVLVTALGATLGYPL